MATTDTTQPVPTLSHMGAMSNELFQELCAFFVSYQQHNLAPVTGPQFSAQDNLTAKAGGGQGGGPTINRVLNRVTTVASANDSITLPPAIAGMVLTVANAAASNSMNVFPATGEKINALSNNAAFAVAANKVATFYCMSSGKWHTTLTA